MKTLVCLLEERSAKELLQIVLKEILPSDMPKPFIFYFEGKQDLERNIVRKISQWRIPDSVFLIMRDKDAADCIAVKRQLVSLCNQTRKPCIVRIACQELESFYLGDLSAVKQAFHCAVPSQKSRKFRDPDHLSRPSGELERITNGAYQKISGSQSIAPFLRLDGSNRSRSFNVLIEGIKHLLELDA